VQVIVSPAASGAAMSCYSIYTDNSADPRFKCDCTQPPGMRWLPGSRRPAIRSRRCTTT